MKTSSNAKSLAIRHFLRITLSFTLYTLHFTLFTLFSCGKLNEIRVVGSNFEDEIQLAQNLVFTFNKDLVRESDLNSWEATKYVEFKPAVAGKFKWTAPNELVFSPTAGFDPATEYRADLNEVLTSKVADKKYGVSSSELTFHTPFLQLVETETYWTKSRESGKPLAKVKLQFNYPVNGSEISEKLEVKSGEKVLEHATAANQTAQSNITNALITNNIEEQSLTILLKKGLKVPNTAHESKADIAQTAVLPSPLTLEVKDVQTGFENNHAFVKITTTQELQPDNLANYFTIQPAVAAKAELTENGFIVRGDFNQTDTYVLTITNQTKGVLGVQLPENVSKDLFFGQMPAAVAFTNKKAVYLSAKGARNVGINVVNVPKVQVKIAKVYQNNILQFLRNNRYDEYGVVGTSEEGYENYGPTGKFNYNEDDQQLYSDLIVNKTIETENLPKIGGVSALNLGLPDASNNFQGIYVVSVQSKDEQYLQATQLVSISDIGLIAKQSGEEVWVFANSIKTTEPLENVEIHLISSNNQDVATLKTDSKGIAKFDKLSEKAANFKIAMITANVGGEKAAPTDFNYLVFDDTRVETSRFDVAGKRDNASGFEAFIYGERNIYRPGETIHFNTVVRKQNWQSPGSVPIKIRVLLPNGKELKVIRGNTGPQGDLATTLPLDKAAVTGTYSIEISNANEVLLASQNVSVEEFMPDRIKVDVKTDRAFYQTGQSAALSATALNLFGPPASGRNYEMDFSLKRKAFVPEKFKSYLFDIPNNTKFENTLRQGVTNDSGLANETFLLNANYQDMGVLEGKIYVTVFDETGRPVNRLKRFDVFTQSIFYGIKLADSYVGLNAPLPIALVALDKDANPKTATAQVEIVRIEYLTVVERIDNQLRYASKKREKVVYSNVANLAGGKGEVRYVPTVSGEYEVRVRRVGAMGYSVASFYAYGWGSTAASSFEVSNEGQVLMEFDKPKYQIGEKATVLFKTPFKGKLLVSVERNKVLEYKYIDTDSQSAEFQFTITDDHLPNAYVTATLIRALDNSALPLTVAHGFAPVPVEDPDTKMPVEIVAVEKSRSKTKQTIKVRAARNAQVTIAVVDEGILQIKNYQTPDIHGFFYQKRALEVGSHDLYQLLFPELSLASVSSTGGDGYDLEKRVNPLSNGRVNLVAFWSGTLNTGLSGEAEFEVEVPQFSGDLRIMAVAYKDNAFGSANKNMKVADPIVISTALPRFLSPDDEVIVPVNISNTEKKPVNVSVSVNVGGNLTQNSAIKTQNLSIAPEKESRTNFTIKAAQAMGNGTVTITVNNGKEKFTEKTELTVRPATSLLKTAQSGVIAGGSNATIDLTNNGFIPSTVKSRLVLSRSPLVQYAKALDYLLGYPHGCVEQTISKAFPQIYFTDLAKLLKTSTYMVKTGDSDFNPTFNVQAAIQKVEAMQLFNGAVSYWPATTDESWWGTAYATHFLLEAQRAGFEVSTSSLGKMIDYLTTKTNAPALETELVYSESGSYVAQQVASRSAIYSLYVLSMAGKPNRASMNYYKQNNNLLTNDSRYLLTAAFKQIGSPQTPEGGLKPFFQKKLAPPSGAARLGSSPILNLALVLNTLIETDPNDLQIPVLARQLSQALNATAYLSTQEASFAFLALGKLAKKNANSTVTAKITVDNKVYPFDGKDLIINTNSPLRGLGAASGKGSLYWFAQTEGLSATGGYVEEDANLRVRKQFLNRFGQPMSSFKQNDLVVVKITLSSTAGTPVENVVVTDLLPAAFEIENPRLTEPRDMPWIKTATVPDHFDLRDDRINYYTSATATEKTFYYLVRVITKGTFALGPVSADAMYSGEYRSYSGGGKVKVE
ncbi:MAG: alpha-2-macroglobulin family protein [Runella slithyformis]|nr:MAG: alpha-2-macroglobulin family protein [Runella slithyformis]TAF29958.1 MAG: alpha-2-macroglobulin family protein [Runella slithyformis]TAF49074.1 MAG: alpha-2-macroglobulin family protein [Runella slithyformis]TAF83569.1 MAG: alpha-2-macroglobulin family protein [Runella slithyformis]